VKQPAGYLSGQYDAVQSAASGLRERLPDEQGLHLGFGKNGGQAFGTLCQTEIRKIADLYLKNAFIEKHDGAQGLFLGGCRHIAVHGEMGKKLNHFWSTPIFGAAFLMKLR
jgi:hypothetical protein